MRTNTTKYVEQHVTAFDGYMTRHTRTHTLMGTAAPLMPAASSGSNSSGVKEAARVGARCLVFVLHVFGRLSTAGACAGAALQYLRGCLCVHGAGVL